MMLGTTCGNPTVKDFITSFYLPAYFGTCSVENFGFS